MDLTAHPCFNDEARLRYSRVHLPVAPACNVQCNFCDRKFDCANESRPGVTSAILSPTQAADYVDDVLEKDPSLRVVGIAGPGDPLANSAATLESLRLVRIRHPEMLLCLATNGLALPQHADAIAELAVSHVTVTVSAIDPEIGGRIYQFVKHGGNRLTGVEAGKRILEAQLAGIQKLVERKVMVKINCIVIPGVNDHHVADVAKEVARLGASRFNCLPLLPVQSTPFGVLAAPSKELMHEVRATSGVYLPQMEHCARCRADAVGRVGHQPSEEQLVLLRSHAKGKHRMERPYVAVASNEGMLVNQHLGEATEFWIFGRRGDGFVLMDKRTAPEEGHGESRWQQLANVLSDCRALLVSDAGMKPRTVLEGAGIGVYATEGLIESLLDSVYQGAKIPKARAQGFSCGKGANCGGNGMMCG